MREPEAISSPPTQLQRDLQARIAQLVHDEALEPGFRLNEHRLARRLGVSRTPVRAAIDRLAAEGFLARRPHKGVELIARPPAPRAVEAVDGGVDALLVLVARDRGLGRLDAETSESELMRRYGASRARIRDALARLADLGIIDRKPGYGWRFVDAPQDSGARVESYRFRLIVEPAAIVEPGFALDRGWSSEMRARHEATLAAAASGRWSLPSSIAFFEMNAAFHDGLGAASGNRYLAQAIHRQTRLRRLSNYNWTHGAARVLENCREHLDILDRIESGDREMAAMLMRRHLEGAARLRPSFETTN